MTDSFREQIHREQSKHDRNWSPAERWQAYLSTLAWAESQATVGRNRKAASLAHQDRLLAQFATHNGVIS